MATEEHQTVLIHLFHKENNSVKDNDSLFKS